ncbi:hypothetical protein BJ165DRAFT_868876 [Panaeolus papilionaceus]|nr:hypothetical protein BJ165DRAFT_868876 [Panaeolus papilionaceus]
MQYIGSTHLYLSCFTRLAGFTHPIFCGLCTHIFVVYAASSCGSRTTLGLRNRPFLWCPHHFGFTHSPFVVVYTPRWVYALRLFCGLCISLGLHTHITMVYAFAFFRRLRITLGLCTPFFPYPSLWTTNDNHDLTPICALVYTSAYEIAVMRVNNHLPYLRCTHHITRPTLVPVWRRKTYILRNGRLLSPATGSEPMFNVCWAASLTFGRILLRLLALNLGQ